MEEKEKKETKELKPQEKSKSYILIKILIFLIIIGSILFLYARYISTSGLIVKEYKIESTELPENFNGLKVIHFTDLHYGTTINNQEMKNLVKRINELKPDIVVFTGDLLDKDHQLTSKQKDELKAHLSDIDATLFKYIISGNHDYSDTSYQSIIENTDFIYLNSERKDIYYEGKEPISIYGFPSSISDQPDYSILNEENNNFKLVLMHEPDSIDDIIINNPDLVLAGHSHGGQVRAPFFGALYTPIGCKKYYDAYYSFENTDLYISSGLGTSGLKVRFLNRPSINLYRLYSIPQEKEE